MNLEFKNWLENMGEITKFGSNVDDPNVGQTGLRSIYTGGRRRPDKASNVEKIFKFKKHKK